MDWVKDGAGWKPVPDNKLYVIDLTASPPKLIDTVTVGKQPSGMSINRAGNLEVNGEKVTYTKRDIPVGLWPYNFDIAPDGRLALSDDNGAGGRSDGHADT